MVAEYSVWQQGIEVNYAALCEVEKMENLALDE